MANQKRVKRNTIESNKIILGVLGFIISLIGLLLAFKTNVDNTTLFLIYLFMIIIGVVLVAKALGSD